MRSAIRKRVYTGVKSKLSSYLEGGVVVAEAVLLVGFAFPIWATIKNDFPAEEESTIVNVIAEQFAWNVILRGRRWTIRPNHAHEAY